MKRILIVFLAVLIPSVAFPGIPFEATLEEMAERADHILIGRVTGVDMIDESGKPVLDGNAMTGPGLKKTIRLLIAVDEVLVTNAAAVPKVLPVPLDSHLYYSLRQIRNAHNGDTVVRLVILQGEHFVGIKPGVFLRPISDRDEALRIYHAAHP